MANITRAPAPIVAVFESASSIRIIMINGEPWFVAADVCRALNIQNPTQVCAKLDDDERAMFHIGRQGSATVVNESGLSCIILRCDDAVRPGTIPHKFRKWVTGEVLPSIRKTGYYVAPTPEPEPEPERSVTIEELQQLKLCARGISRYFPSISEDKALAAIYSRIKSEHRIRRIEQFPASRFGDSIAWLRSVEEQARAHWFAMRQYQEKVMAELGIPLNN